MDCKDIKNWLSGYTSESNVTPEISRHFAECPECRQAWQLIEATEKLMDEEKQKTISPFFQTRLEAAIEAEYHKENAFYQLIKPKLAVMLVAAGMMVGIILPLTFGTINTVHPDQPQDEFLFFEMASEPNEMDLLNELI